MPEPISIIVPVFEETENVLPMAREVAAAFAAVPNDWELVFVDDGSRDATWAKVCEAARANPRVRGVRHTRNAGQSAALWTGIQQTDRPLLATLDGDLQNDPADLPRLLAELDSCDFACGWRQNRQDTFVRRVSSRLARAARRAALGAEFRDTGCALRVFRRAALAGVFGFNGLHRFLPILVAGGGFRVREVPVNHRPRVAGVSKYGVWNRLGRGLYDLVAIAWYQRRRFQPVPVEHTPASR
ncbi:MAG: glycosyl transferase family protein [Limisphaerales bacterium]|nr:MAG: glycosyl transferase family protein [Limisphaerales bacterium]KAG0509034.1 MAG: glycosyl transferase family protein [Limisphaerales bacterium]